MKIYEDREELLNSVRSIAFAQGYATTIRRSKKDKYVIIGSHRGELIEVILCLQSRERERWHLTL